MTRRQFIESNGATCKNWNWSWSFINEKEKIIIFGAWDFAEAGHMAMIFSHDWKFSDKKRKNAGYNQSLEHIRLVEEEGYKLKTFPIYYSDDNKDDQGFGPAKIAGFKPELEERFLAKAKNKYYALLKSGLTNIPEEVTEPGKYFEGASSQIAINTYERNAKARMDCIEYFGYECQVCEFNFEKVYGQLGKDYIHVHHIIPLSEIRENYKVNAITDLIPVCPNCHAIIHRTKQALTIEALKEQLKKQSQPLTMLS